MFTLLRGARVYAPEELGRKDVLLCAGEIVNVADRIDPASREGWGQVETVSLEGRMLVPGFIDAHLHFLGGGGGGGPATRIPEIFLSGITRWGITTAVACLGVDTEAKSLKTLLAKAHALESEGLTTYLYNGWFKFPLATLLDNARSDLMLIEKILGIKMVMGEERGSELSPEELALVASDAFTGGSLGGKPGLIHIHLGTAPRSNPYPVIARAMEISDVPARHWVLTHVNWSEDRLRGACEFIHAGTYINVDGVLDPRRGSVGAVEPEKAILRLLEAGLPWDRLTLTTDGNGSVPRLHPKTGTRKLYRLGTETLLQTVRRLAESGKVSLPRALGPITNVVAEQLGIADRKGTIRPGADADLVVLTEDLRIDRVYARGRLMVLEGRPVVLGVFESPEQLDEWGELMV